MMNYTLQVQTQEIILVEFIINIIKKQIHGINFGDVTGFIHVFDIVKFDNKLFVCGSADGNYSAIQSSADGENFENVPIYVDDVEIDFNRYDRFYGFTVHNGRLYAYHPRYDASNEVGHLGMYEYDNESGGFKKISDLFAYDNFRIRKQYVIWRKMYSNR